ncbi:MAG TPA: DUF5131 family protein, partial [Armatimonadota bacterium]|nr:DUF5131 family protein [Armatimonadota bacterium]
NIVVGCLHRCLAHLKDKHGEPVKCWAEQLAYRIGCATGCELCKSFTPHIHPERWAQITPGGAPKVIGLGFMSDLCGDWDWPGLSFVQHETLQAGLAFHKVATIVPRNVTTQGLFEYLLPKIVNCPRHTFVSLTQRPDRLPKLDYPDNWFIGPTVHNQQEADKRIGELLASGVTHCIVSYEPATGPVDFRPWLCAGPFPLGPISEHIRQTRTICGIIAGGMSGPGAVPANPDWFRRVRDDCAEAGVPFYYKQGPDDSGRAFTHMPVLDGRQYLELPWELPVRKQKSPVTSEQEAEA